jgi:pimeloyl-ACP methyl ester carboxylesterase
MPELTQAERFAQAAKAAGAAQAGQAIQAPAAPPRSWTKRLLRLGVILAALYVGACLAIYVFQKRIVYNPTTAEDLSVKLFGFAEHQAQDLTTKASDGIQLRGWRIMGLSGYGKLSQARHVILFFTGKAGNRSQHDGKFQRLAALGGDVVCFDYRGYGESAGSPDEEGLARDARAAWDFLRHEGVKAESIVLYGESLGTAVATRLACELSAEHTPPAGVIMEGAFPRLLDPARHVFFWLPVTLILNQQFPSVDRIPQLECPLLMVHGAHDNTVPIAMGRTLFAAAPAACRGVAKAFVECPNAGHVNMDTLDAALYEKSLRDFLTAAVSSKPGHSADKREKRKVDFRSAVKPK